MFDWPWFGWAIAGSAFAGSAAGYAARKILHVDDMAGAYVMAGAFLLFFGGLLVAKVRYEARWRQYRLMADYEAPPGKAYEPDLERRDGT